MERKIREVAARIKDLREIFGISQEEMARKTDVTLEEYQQLEAGASDFNFTFIYKCAQTLHVEVTDLLEGTSPRLSSYEVTRKGEGLSIARRKGFVYNGLAPLFRDKISEPFFVTAPCEADENAPIHLSTHEGQELDIIQKGRLKVQINDHVEILEPGDSIYYDSGTPHGMIAIGGEPCEFIAIVMNPAGRAAHYPVSWGDVPQGAVHAPERSDLNKPVAEPFVQTTVDENGVVNGITFSNEEEFNFAFDIVDKLAEKCPDKLALLHISNDKQERRFTFGDMKKYSNMTANYLMSLGVKRGDKVMVVLKRHYQFWFALLALHKIGAVAVPATNQLVEHDFDYRFKAAEISAILCTADGDVAHHVDLAAAGCPGLKTKIIVNGSREGWHDFNEEFVRFSNEFARPEGALCGKGSDVMLMFFTSGTTGYPKIAMHDYKYPLGHYITAKYWHNVNPDGLHFTISDTGWVKALWGKIYGQWLCEAAIFAYDFDRFNAQDILPMFEKYHITTFCAPPTMYRFFIREDISKYDFSSLEYAAIAGEALNPEVFQQFYKATGLKIMEGFGQTETGVVIGNFVNTTPKPGSMGKASPLYEVDIVDADDNPVNPGETGEIVVRTRNGKPNGLFMGYYHAEDKTTEVWHDDHYHTGDTAWKDEDGYFWYVGRADDVIKSSGYRIGPFEIESVIMELPYVLECAITAAPDEIRGQVVKATIVLTKDKEPSDALKKEVQTYVKEHTAPYKYPRIVEFVEALPKTISGKIKRAELRGKK